MRKYAGSRTLCFAVLAGLVLGGGCAKFPSGGTNDVAHVVFTMKLGGPVRTDYLYYVAIQASPDSSPDPNAAPIPVVTDASVNGFVAGEPTHFVQFEPYKAQQLNLYAFLVNDGKLDLTGHDLGQPTFNSTVCVPTTDSQHFCADQTNTLSFEISLDQLTGGDVTKAKALKFLQVNFLTMNKLARSSNAGRYIDALGVTTSASGINTPVTIPLTSSHTYNNANFGYIEPPDDVISNSGHTTEPDLDIVDWSVEVRLP